MVMAFARNNSFGTSEDCYGLGAFFQKKKSDKLFLENRITETGSAHLLLKNNLSTVEV